MYQGDEELMVKRHSVNFATVTMESRNYTNKPRKHIRTCQNTSGIYSITRAGNLKNEYVSVAMLQAANQEAARVGRHNPLFQSNNV